MKFDLWRVITTCLALCCCHTPFSSTASGAQKIRCDLQTCIEMAFATHPALKAGEARQAAARSEIDVRLGAFKPTLALEGETGYLAGESLSPFAAISGVTEEGARQRAVTGGYYQGTVGIALPLVKEGTLLGRSADSVQQAQLKVSEENWEMQVDRLEVASKVVETYIEVLKKRRALEIQKTLAASLEASYQLSLARYQQNLISRNDLLIAEVRFATAKRELSAAHRALQKGQRDLAWAMGLDHTQGVEVQELQGAPLALLPVEQLITRAQETRPELKVQQLKVQGSSAEVRRIQSERYPTVSLSAHYGVVDDFSGRPSDQFLTAVKVRVPLFDFGLIKNKAEVARARSLEEEKRLLDFQGHIEREIYDLYAQAQELAEEAELIKKQIEQASEAAKLNRAMYQQELLPLSTALDAEAALRKLQLALSDAEYNQQSARFRLGLLCGTWTLQQP
jgi:outer membrane protein